MIVLFLISGGTSTCFSKMATPIYIPANGALRFPALHIITNTCSLLSFPDSHPNICHLPPALPLEPTITSTQIWKGKGQKETCRSGSRGVCVGGVGGVKRLPSGGGSRSRTSGKEGVCRQHLRGQTVPRRGTDPGRALRQEPAWAQERGRGLQGCSRAKTGLAGEEERRWGGRGLLREFRIFVLPVILSKHLASYLINTLANTVISYIF